MGQPIYLDNNASTALAPDVRTAMIQAMDGRYANAASAHRLGLDVKQCIETAREQIAQFLGASSPSEIMFTGGATEAIGEAFAQRTSPGAVAIGAAEHAAVINAAERLCCDVLRIPVQRSGELDLAALERALSNGVTFVSVAWVNSETGVITDISGVSDLCRRAGVALHVDAAQAVGRVNIDLRTASCDFLTLSPHKFHGPKGIGILFTRRGPKQTALHRGTPNTVAIVGASVAIQAAKDWSKEAPRIGALRDRLENALLEAIPGADVNGSKRNRVANTSNIYFPRRNAADLVQALSRRELYVSAGAACSSGSAPSHVIRALGWDDMRANGSVRFSLSKLTTNREIEAAYARVTDAYENTLPTETT